MSKTLTAVIVGAALITSTAACAAEQAALPPGHPAGVHNAQISAPTWVWIAGIGLIGLGIGLAASSGGGNSSGTTTSTHL